jgi:hypothetical protein
MKGRLGPDPVFMPASKWATTLVGDSELRPDSLYWIKMICDLGQGPFESDQAGAITWRRGDTDGNNEVNALDIGQTVDVVRAVLQDEATWAASNVWDCDLDPFVNALDIAAVVNAVRNAPVTCTDPCP